MTPKSSLSQIILASTSRARREMLAAAGVAFTVEAADVDEPAVRETLLAAKSAATPPQIADALARAKAEDVSQRHKGSLVIGGDQVLALGTELLTKAKDEAAARATLKKLRGMTHELHSAVALAVDGRVLWTHTGTARLKMR
ncbi:MAG: Maf family protein, partial [Hyphomicrobium sp.]